MENFVFNPLKDKSPQGPCKMNTRVTYNLKVSKFIWFEKAFFVIHKDGYAPESFEMEKTFTDEKYIYLSFNYDFKEVGHFWYHFEVKTKNNYFRLVKGENLDCVCSDADTDFLQLVYLRQSNIDDSFKRGIIYHIFVDRFNSSGKVKARKGLQLVSDWNKEVGLEYNEAGERCNSNCYGGNLKGIIEKLDYLKSLNVSTIYLSPIFEANSSHKYNTADYSKVDSMFGDNKILQDLITKAKAKGINIILDGVFNHTGSDSIYFNKYGRYKSLGAYQSKKSPYYSWYDFSSYPDTYSSWWGVKSLPQVREDSSFFDYIAGKNGVIEKYMSLGLGGFRLDVVDELTNKFLLAICKAVRKVNPRAMMVGEVWEDASSKISYDERKNYFLGETLDSVTNYPMKNAILDFVRNGKEEQFVNTVSFIKDQYPIGVRNSLMNIIDTHDTMRALTFLGMEDFGDADSNGKYNLTKDEREKGIKLLKIASLMQYTVFGLPTVFYGDEAGIEGMRDPYCRKPYPWGRENKELITWYQKLGELRKKEVFDGGEMNILYAKDGVIIYDRTKGNKRILLAVNMSSNDFSFELNNKMTNYFTGKSIDNEVLIKSQEFILLEK